MPRITHISLVCLLLVGLCGPALAQGETRSQKDARLFLSIIRTACVDSDMNVETAKVAWGQAKFNGKPLEGRRIEDTDKAALMYDMAVQNPRTRDEFKTSGMTRDRFIRENATPPKIAYVAVFRLEESPPYSFIADQIVGQDSFTACNLGGSFEDTPAGLAAIEAVLKLENRSESPPALRPSGLQSHPTLAERKITWSSGTGNVRYTAMMEHYTTNPLGKIVLTATLRGKQ